MAYSESDTAMDRVATGNPQSFTGLRRLVKAAEWSRERLAPFRLKRAAMVRELVGKHYSDAGSAREVPTNFLEMLVSIYTHSLAARSPRVMCRTKIRQLKPDAADLEAVLNMDLRRLAVGDTVARCVTDALLSMGVMKVGLEAGGEFDDPETGERVYTPRPFADTVDLDDWCHDMAARNWREIAFCGDRYEVPLEVAKDNSEYNKPAREKLKASDQPNVGDDRAAASITRSADWMSEGARLDDMVVLWDYYLPRQNLVVTVAEECGEYDAPLMVREWGGPQFGGALGPYHTLRFRDVPGQTMPLSLASMVFDLHNLGNELFLKSGDQAERQKTVTTYRGGSEEDAKRVRDAKDGEIIRVDGEVKEHKYGGADPTTLAMTLQIRGLVSYFGGNLDVLGGLSAQSGTASQDQLLAAQAGKRIEDMQARVLGFTTDVVRSLAFYRWHNPIEDVVAERVIPGFVGTLPVRFSADTRRGEFPDYDIDIEPYSMQPQTPQTRLAAITQVWQQFIAPFAPIMAEQGISPNFEGTLRTIAQLTSMSELEDMLTFTGPPTGMEPKARGSSSAKPSTTTRRYERTNRPGMTQKGQDEVMIQALIGGGLQKTQEQAIGRGVS